MGLPVAAPAKGDEVVIDIRAELRAVAEVMDLEVLPASAPLTAPTIAFHYLPAELSIVFRGEAYAIALADTCSHAACSSSWAKRACSDAGMKRR